MAALTNVGGMLSGYYCHSWVLTENRVNSHTAISQKKPFYYYTFYYIKNTRVHQNYMHVA